MFQAEEAVRSRPIGRLDGHLQFLAHLFTFINLRTVGLNCRKERSQFWIPANSKFWCFLCLFVNVMLSQFFPITKCIKDASKEVTVMCFLAKIALRKTLTFKHFHSLMSLRKNFLNFLRRDRCLMASTVTSSMVFSSA